MIQSLLQSLMGVSTHFPPEHTWPNLQAGTQLAVALLSTHIPPLQDCVARQSRSSAQETGNRSTGTHLPKKHLVPATQSCAQGLGKA